MAETAEGEVNAANIARILANDTKVKVAGVDADGILRGKIMAKDKFLSSIDHGFGMSSAVFGWDMHDVLYANNTDLTSDDQGYADFTAIPDLRTFRRLSWENGTPFVLLRFQKDGEDVPADGRSMLSALGKRLENEGMRAFAGVELEFFNFQVPGPEGYGEASNERPDLAGFLERNSPSSLRSLTGGMFGYSVSRPMHSKDYFYSLFDRSECFNCNIEGWHTESGPGVYEAALKVTDLCEMADRVTLFKLLAKSTGVEHRIAPCFMAKPVYGLPGNSGHIHISLTNLQGKNLFARETRDDSAQWSDIAWLSDIGRHFLAGVLEALPDIMPLLAPTVNSYKRLIENYWAPMFVNWGWEDRLSSVRLIAPPSCKPAATRFEIRIPGADLHPHYAFAALLAAGWRGVSQKRAVPVPPQSARKDRPARLPRNLESAVDRFNALGSIAREMFGDRFVDFYMMTRQHELDAWNEAVTDWEFKRYIETV